MPNGRWIETKSHQSKVRHPDAIVSRCRGGITRCDPWNPPGDHQAGSVVTAGSPPHSGRGPSPRSCLRTGMICALHPYTVHSNSRAANCRREAVRCRHERRFPYCFSIPQRADCGLDPYLEGVFRVALPSPLIRPACRRGGGKGEVRTDHGNGNHCSKVEQAGTASSGRINIEDDAVAVVVGHHCPGEHGSQVHPDMTYETRMASRYVCPLHVTGAKLSPVQLVFL